MTAYEILEVKKAFPKPGRYIVELVIGNQVMWRKDAERRSVNYRGRTLPHLHRLPESDESNPQPREYERHGRELRVLDNVQDTARRLPRQRSQCGPCLESYWQWPKNYNQAKRFHTNNTSWLVVVSSVLKMSVLTDDPVTLIRYISWPNSGVTTKE